MKRNLLNQLILTGCLVISMGSLAQVTKLSQSDNLGGIILNERPVMVNLKDYSFYTTDGTVSGTTTFTHKVTLEPDGVGKGFITNNKLYFSGIDESHGAELWVTDGTDAGTTMIKDINPGNGNASPRNFCLLNNELYFFADDGVHGIELWKTDGTAAGTMLVKDINPGKDSSLNKDYFTLMGTCNSLIYFFADDGIHGAELWKTDGTNAGTVFVKDINVGGSSFVFDWSRNYNYSIKALGNIVLFTADDGIHGYELWRSDGTSTGTYMIKDIVTYKNTPSWPRDFFLFKNKIYFVLEPSGYYPCDFWMTDGTAEGTQPLKTRFDDDSPNGTRFSHPAVIGDKMIFSSSSNKYSGSSWVSDGTPAGTYEIVISRTNYYLISSLIDMSPINYLTRNEHQTVYKGKAYFSYPFDTRQKDIWATDGTIQGTYLVKTLPRIYGLGTYTDTTQAFFTENAMYLTGRRVEAADSIDIWKTDGTTNGTLQVASVRARSDNEIPLSFQFLYNNQLYFNSYDSSDSYPTSKNFFKLNETVEALPVSLLRLTAQLQQKSVALNWATATEINSSHFDILRSIDGLKYNRIGTVVAAGNSTLVRKYNYNDASVLNTGASQLYYKLQMFDKDGSFKYSNIAMVRLKEAGNMELKLFPNPATSRLTLSIQLRTALKVTLSVIDAGGRIVYHKSADSIIGNYTENINVANLPSGLYYLKLETGSNNCTVSFLKE